MAADGDGGFGPVPEGGVCPPGMTKSCACLGSTTSGKKTCDDKGQYGDCDACGSSGTSTGKPGDSTTGGTGKCGTCDGCCNGSSCVPFADQRDDRCGGKGKICAACSGSTTCDTQIGKCLSAGSCGGCTGCCTSGGGCVDSSETFYDTCGANGSACTVCPIEGSFCTDAGKCTNQVSPYEEYEISIRSINESGSGCTGLLSPTGESNPDPYVCIYAYDPATKAVLVDFEGNPQKGCSDHCNSMGICQLSTAQGVLRRMTDNEPAQFAGDAIKNGQLIVETWDYDYGPSDLVGQGTFPKVTTLAPDATLTAGPYSSGSSGCSVPISYQLAYQF